MERRVHADAGQARAPEHPRVGRVGLVVVVGGAARDRPGARRVDAGGHLDLAPADQGGQLAAAALVDRFDAGRVVLRAHHGGELARVQPAFADQPDAFDRGLERAQLLEQHGQRARLAAAGAFDVLRGLLRRHGEGNERFVALRGRRGLIDQLLVRADHLPAAGLQRWAAHLEGVVEVALHSVAGVGNRAFVHAHPNQPGVVGRQTGHEPAPSIDAGLLGARVEQAERPGAHPQRGRVGLLLGVEDDADG